MIPPEALRIVVYDTLIGTGHMPTSAELGAHFGVSPEAARGALAEARVGKTLLAHPESGELWMAGPFASAPTPYRVVGRRASWWANCAWDMLGIPVIAGEPVDVQAACPDCGAPMRLHVDPSAGPAAPTGAVVHFLVPARRWYDDIGFT